MSGTLISPRHLIAVALVVAIGGLFAWRELRAVDHGPTTVLEQSEAALRVEVGEPVPDFRLDTPDGAELRLSDFRGQAVVLNFWATWCAPCRAEMPDLQALHDAHAATGDLTVVGVDLQESGDSVSSFADELGLTFPLALDRSGDVAERYGLIGLPGTFFIDADGILRARALGQLSGDLLPDGVSAALASTAASQ
jgi:peroxiredoxin